METISEFSTFDTRERGALGFDIRVRGQKYLWGSAGIKRDAVFKEPPVMHLHNDPFGEQITLTVEAADGTQTLLGTLEPGECVSVSIQNMTGLRAACASESLVRCSLN